MLSTVCKWCSASARNICRLFPSNVSLRKTQSDESVSTENSARWGNSSAQSYDPLVCWICCFLCGSTSIYRLQLKARHKILTLLFSVHLSSLTLTFSFALCLFISHLSWKVSRYLLAIRCNFTTSWRWKFEGYLSRQSTKLSASTHSIKTRWKIRCNSTKQQLSKQDWEAQVQCGLQKVNSC